jgi:hypothetical protein
MNNRDIATLIWLGVAALAILLWREGRGAIKRVMGGLASPKLGGIFLAFAAWPASPLVAGHALDLWTTVRTAADAVGVGVLVEGLREPQSPAAAARGSALAVRDLRGELGWSVAEADEQNAILRR